MWHVALFPLSLPLSLPRAWPGAAYRSGLGPGCPALLGVCVGCLSVAACFCYALLRVRVCAFPLARPRCVGLADGADGAARLSLPFLSRVVARALPAAWAGLHALSAPAFQALAGMRGAACVSVRCGVVSPTLFPSLRVVPPWGERGSLPVPLSLRGGTACGAAWRACDTGGWTAERTLWRARVWRGKKKRKKKR